jgi:homoserine O-acetyltransferase
VHQRRHTISIDRPFQLRSGAHLPRLELAVETYGVLNSNKDNAILVCHGLTGNQNAAGEPITPDGPKPWWDCAIGPGKMLDTGRFFVVCANVIGGSEGSTAPRSLDPTTGRPYGMRFPIIEIADMAQGLILVLDYFGVDRLAAAIGGCMGGFQVLELARLHPQRLRRAIAISATPSTSAYTIALWELMRQAIYADPAWNNGDYYSGQPPLSGLGLMSMIGSVLWLDRDVLAEKFGRSRASANPRQSHSFSPEFAVEAFLAQVRSRADTRFDANSLLYLTKAVDLFDLSNGYNSLTAGIEDIAMPTMLVSYEADWRYPRDQIALLAKALSEKNPETQHHHLHSSFGHGAFQFDVSGLAPIVMDFLGCRSRQKY